MQASPAKLRDGSWGVRTQGVPSKGQSVTVTASNGKTWSATIARVLWSGDGVAICATEARSGGSSRRGGSLRRMGSGHGSAANVAGYSSYCTDNEDCCCYDCAS